MHNATIHFPFAATFASSIFGYVKHGTKEGIKRLCTFRLLLIFFFSVFVCFAFRSVCSFVCCAGRQHTCFFQHTEQTYCIHALMVAVACIIARFSRSKCIVCCIFLVHAASALLQRQNFRPITNSLNTSHWISYFRLFSFLVVFHISQVNIFFTYENKDYSVLFEINSGAIEHQVEGGPFAVAHLRTQCSGNKLTNSVSFLLFFLVEINHECSLGIGCSCTRSIFLNSRLRI